MSEARKCDRCHGFYEIPEKQQDKNAPYDLKGAFAKILLCDNNRDYPETVRWFDLCPNCVELLDKWLKNPNVDNTDCTDRSNGATEKELELASKLNDAKNGYCSEEDKKKRWLENHKEEAKLSDPYEEGGL